MRKNNFFLSNASYVKYLTSVWDFFLEACKARFFNMIQHIEFLLRATAAAATSIAMFIKSVKMVDDFFLLRLLLLPMPVWWREIPKWNLKIIQTLFWSCVQTLFDDETAKSDAPSENTEREKFLTRDYCFWFENFFSLARKPFFSSRNDCLAKSV